MKEGPVFPGSGQRQVCKSGIALLSILGSYEQRSWSASEAVLIVLEVTGDRSM